MKKQHPEYKGGKPFDEYGKFIEKYDPHVKSDIGRSPETKTPRYQTELLESHEEKKEGPAEPRHLKSEAGKNDTDKPDANERLKELYETPPDYSTVKKREIRDRDGKIEGGTIY